LDFFLGEIEHLRQHLTCVPLGGEREVATQTVTEKDPVCPASSWYIFNTEAIWNRILRNINLIQK